MPSSDYNKYLTAIKAANDMENKELLRQIKNELIANYGLMDDDVDYLPRPAAGAPLLCGLYGRPMLQ